MYELHKDAQHGDDTRGNDWNERSRVEVCAHGERHAMLTHVYVLGHRIEVLAWSFDPERAIGGNKLARPDTRRILDQRGFRNSDRFYAIQNSMGYTAFQPTDPLAIIIDETGEGLTVSAFMRKHFKSWHGHRVLNRLPGKRKHVPNRHKQRRAH